MAATTQTRGSPSPWSASNLMQTGRNALGMGSGIDTDFEEVEDTDESEEQTLPVMQAVRMIGGAVVGIAVIVLVVNEVLTIGAVSNSTGPFAGVIDSLETTGVAAMTLLVVGLVVVAAQQIMSYMGGGF